MDERGDYTELALEINKFPLWTGSLRRTSEPIEQRQLGDLGERLLGSLQHETLET